MNKNTIITTVPAAGALHKVPGFDPLKYLKRVVGSDGKTTWRLDPAYQRLWFRLACPNGRMLLTPLRVTDQLAIFEAKVFLNRDDPVPAGSFTANKSAQDTRNYIRDAQEEALKEALDSAGFGIQLCDLTHTAADDAPLLPAPPTKAKETVPVPTGRTSKAVQPDAGEPAPVPPENAAPTLASPEPAPIEEPKEEIPQGTSDEAPQEAVGTEGSQSSLLSMLESPPSAEKITVQRSPETPTAITELEVESTEPPYTDDTPIEQILQCMTMEEAGNVMVQKGTCKGMRMEEIARRRPSSLHFFLTQFCECGNIQKAAAHLLIQDLELKKAG